MVQSTFAEYIDKFWPPVMTGLAAEIEAAPDPYLFKLHLRKTFSRTMQWSTLSAGSTKVAADVVSLNSSLPLKKRNSMKQASGEITKLGMALQLNEQQMQDLLAFRGNPQMQGILLSNLFADSKTCLNGVNEQLEKMFIEALSTGLTVVNDNQNVGLGVRLDFGYLPQNKYGAAFSWANPLTSRPLDDIQNLLDNTSAGSMPAIMWMNKTTYNQFVSSTQVKANYFTIVGGDPAAMRGLTRTEAEGMIDERFGLVIKVINKTTDLERNGIITRVRPWASNTVIFTPSDIVGSLFWTFLAESQTPNIAVSYTTVDEYVLLSKFHGSNPFTEVTSSQALVIPVIEDVLSIYMLETTDTEAAAQVEGDGNITVFGSAVLRTNLINQLNLVGENAVSSMTDAQLIGIVNKLSKANETKVKTGLGL